MNTEKKLTAMQELRNHISKKGIKNYPLDTLNLITELIEKEKQQLYDFYWNGCADRGKEKYAEDLYNETYKN